MRYSGSRVDALVASPRVTYSLRDTTHYLCYATLRNTLYDAYVRRYRLQYISTYKGAYMHLYRIDRAISRYILPSVYRIFNRLSIIPL